MLSRHASRFLTGIIGGVGGMNSSSTTTFSNNSNAFRSNSSSISMVESNEVIGVDLGTTYSCVAILEGETPKVVENSEGSRTTPSVVGFKGHQKLVGSTAKRQLVTNPSSTFYAVKRLIGRRFSDEKTKQDMKTMPYKIVEHSNGDAWVQDSNSGKKYSPSQIGAFVLEKMKQTAESRIGKKVSRAVITCPAYFNDAQRAATKDAGAIAGLTVERVINEPTAAALAYGIKTDKDKKIVVYDLGGGTFDVSVLDIAGGVFAVNATNGDTHLGGEDFDIALQEYILKEFKKESGLDLTNNKIAVQRVREAAENAKVELSSALQTQVNLPFLAVTEDGPQNLQMTITRDQLETVCADLIERTLMPCHRCLRDSGLEKDELSEVVLVGGMTRMPKVASTVQKFFNREPFRGVNPDEAVALGAAIQGGVLKGKVGSLVLLDVTPLTLGFELEGGVFKRVIPKNTTIPCTKTVVTTTVADNQTSVQQNVYQGEREMAADNKYLGGFVLGGIPAAPRGVPQILTTFQLDANGMLHVTAKDKATGRNQSVSIQSGGGLSKDEVERMIQESKMYEKTDKLRKETVEAKNEAERSLHTAQSSLSSWKHVQEQEKEQVKKLVEALRKVIDNPNSSRGDLDEAAKNLNQAVMECGKTEYNAQAAANK